jgi:hypothetical protein
MHSSRQADRMINSPGTPKDPVDDSVLIPDGDVVFRRLEPGSGGVLLTLSSGDYFGVNDTGALVWELLGVGGRRLADLFPAVRAQLHDPPDDLEDDIRGFLRSMLERGLVRLGPAGD